MERIITDDLELIRRDSSQLAQKIDGKTCLITGGAGFLGSWMCDILSVLGARIICVDDLSSGSKKNIEHLHQSDFLFIKEDVAQLSITEEVDYMIHMACIASPALYQENNLETLDTSVLGTRNMLELARQKNPESFLFTSTSEVYGDAGLVPTPESYWGNVNPIGPRSVYDEGKRVAETYCVSYLQRYGLPVRIARIFNTYGPRLDTALASQYGRVIVRFLIQAMKNEPLTVYGNGSQTRSFCYIRDQIEGLLHLLIMREARGEIVNIGSGEEISIIDLAKLIINIAKSGSLIAFSSLPQDDPKRRAPNLDKARSLLGWVPKTTLEEGLTRTLEWLSSSRSST